MRMLKAAMAIVAPHVRDWLKTAYEGLSGCGHRTLPKAGCIVPRRTPDGRRHVSGTLHCARHLCPVCGTWNARRRREELLKLIPIVAALGRHFHAVFTLRHHYGVRWRELRDAVCGTWRTMQQTKVWRSMVVGFVRADETTFSANGHHFHVHSLLTLRKDGPLTPEQFAAWIQDYWETHALKHGRTAAWADGWWSEVAEGALDAVVAYTTKDAQLDLLPHVLGAEILAGASKRGAAPWDLEAPAFAEVWVASKGHRWFGCGGCWRTDAVDEVSEDEKASAQREKTGIEVPNAYHPTAREWQGLRRDARDWLIAIVHNPAIDEPSFVQQWNGYWHSRGDVDYERATAPPCEHAAAGPPS